MNPKGGPHIQYPVGLFNVYGPDNTRATKLVAVVVKSPDPQAEQIMRRWFVEQGDIRNDPFVAAEVVAFFKQHGVKQTVSYDRIIGCPHQEGIDYPMGRQCPHCPFWANIDRFTHQPIKPPEPTRTPEQILAELSEVRTTQPLEALKSTEAHRAALVEPLLQAIERGLGNPSGLPEGQRMLFRYATYLLAKWREPRAYPLVVRWLSLPEQGAFELGGETVTRDGDRLLASVCDGNLDPIKALILNRQANERCRGQAVKALGLLGLWAEVPREPVEDYLLWLAQEGLERQSSPVWNDLAAACLGLEAVRVFPELRRAYAEGLIDPSLMPPATLDEIERKPRGQWIEQQREERPPIYDVAKATAWWPCFPEAALTCASELPEDTSEEDSTDVASWPKLVVGTVSKAGRDEPRKIGRNDPCPCGSGKKYKKCCGK